MLGPPIEAVIFDYGGVISQSPFGRLGSVERRLGLAPGALADLLGYGVDVPEPVAGEPYTNRWHLLEIGAIELPEYVAWVHERGVALLGPSTDLTASLAGTLGGIGIHWMVVQRIRSLREEGYRLALCTNNIAALRSVWADQFPIELFDEVVDSSEVGVRKPDPAIYLLTCERLGVAAERCAFLDDHPGNVAAAEALGMAGVLVGDDPWEALGELDRVLTARAPIAGART